jgi:membrane protein required for colicin V production
MPELLSFKSWLWIDYVIAGTILISAVGGLLRGLVKEIMALITWLAAVWVAMNFSRDFSAVFEHKLTEPVVRTGVAFLALFLATLIVGRLIQFFVGKLLQTVRLTSLNRLGGMGFGLVRGAFLIEILVFSIGVTPLAKDNWWQQSQLLPPFQSLAVWLRAQMPSDWTGSIPYH